MTKSPKSKFVYVTFIRTTPQRLWEALTDPEQMKLYWFGARGISDWKPGSPWKLQFDDGRLADSGEILEADPPRRLAIKWLNEWNPEIKAEGYGLCVMELEPTDGAVKLTITHSSDAPNSQLINAVSGGWPKVLSNLKSLVETGRIALGDYDDKAGLKAAS